MRITVNKLKNASISAQTLLEEIFPKEQSLLDIENSLNDAYTELEKLEEALFYKQEKLNTENMKYLEYDFGQLKLKKYIDIKESETLKSIINLQSEYDNLIITERFLKVYEFIKNNLDIEFKDLMQNKIEEEKFICFCFSELENDIFIGTKIRELKEKMEKYLINKFEDSFSDFLEMKAIYESSYFLNEGYPLLKIYVNNIEILKQPLFISKEEINLINLDNFTVQDDFLVFIEKIKDTYKKEEKIIKEVFFDQNRILNLINQRLFEDVIASNLDILLENKPPLLFVNNLEQAYHLIEDVYSFLRNIYSEFSNTMLIEDLFSSYISLLSLKERSSFDEIFDFIIFKKSLKMNYFVVNDNLKYESDYNTKFKVLVHLFLSILKRYKIFFKHEEIDDYFDHYLRKFNEFFDHVINYDSESDKLKVIDELSEYYLVIKQILINEEIYSFDILTDLFSQKTKKFFRERIILSETKIKKLFYEMSFTEYSEEQTNTINKLVNYLNKEISIVKQSIEGPNGIKFMILLMNSVYSSYYKKILSFKFGMESSTLLKDTKKLLSFCKANVPDVVKSYDYLLEVVQLIAINKNDIEAYYSSIYEKIPSDEAKKILKCRIDYRTINYILYEK